MKKISVCITECIPRRLFEEPAGAIFGRNTGGTPGYISEDIPGEIFEGTPVEFSRKKIPISNLWPSF